MKLDVRLLVFLLLMSGCAKDPVIPLRLYECQTVSSHNSAFAKAQDYQTLLNNIVNNGVPGIMMSISFCNGATWTGSAGFADLSSNVPLEGCHITRVGSTVKTFTATTVLLLAEEGKLSLDDPITDYLSADLLRNLKNAKGSTIRNLLQHSSGIYNYIVNPKFQTASLNDLTKVWSRDELLGYARGMDATFSVGEDVQYSNTNYILLGEIITAVEGKPFYKVFEEKIFQPLHLNFTRFAAEDPIPSGIVRGYVDLYSNYNLIDATRYSGWDYYTADGGLISNSHDLTKFMEALFNEKLISKSSLEQMLQWKDVPLSDDSYINAYGLGIFRIDTPFGVGYMHSGDAIGYYACMVYFPDQCTTIAWAVNGNYGALDEHAQTKEAMLNIFKTILN